ncbi:MAG: isoleucyl-tRNA synthetase [Parcubacteria group bacterium Gr01-1014_24]|nr:MAG: isoleucyl-tRNA synthetase [Parcubacteria group bacterium Gr01-1014_24]
MAEKGTNEKSDAAFREEAVLEFWQKNKIFEKSLGQTEGKKEFIFYEGPPTANGEPGIHHLEARAFKDAIPRYKTMCGYHVRRKGGWDTHGLAVEIQTEQKLGLNSKKAIEEYSIAKFNQKCKESVWEYLDVWNKFTKRIGYWLDQENPYVTYHNDYIESLWNVVKKINEQDLLYKDYKVVPWCPRCGTVLSSHELAQGYEDDKDLSVTVKFKVKGQENTYILAWTTTPWTLPGNVALAVEEDIIYIKVKVRNEILILAKERVSILTEGYEILEEVKGKDLIGLEYEPLFPCLADTISESEKSKLEKAYKVYAADFVNTEEGTGIVHTAVMYGQDDFVLGTKLGLPKHHLVNLEGKFIKGTGFLEGRLVKEKDISKDGEPGKPTLDLDIIKYLADKNLFFSKENYQHSYPHCWRCQTPLIYYARDSWYIKMSNPGIKEQMIKENREINWEPSHIRDGRFGEWLREIKDWAISRERYWGTPLPVWVCESCKKVEVIGSIAGLREKTEKSGNKYFVMRHGEADNNVNNFHHQDSEHKANLTKNGERQVLESAQKLARKIDVIISSPLNRAKQTAKITCEQIGFPLEKVIYDERVQEWETSSFFEGKDRTLFRKYYDVDYLNDPFEILSDGENFVQVVKRIGDFIYDLEKKYSDKNILIVGHDGATRALSFVLKGLLFSGLSIKNNPLIYLQNAEVKEFDFIPLPHNENYELDLHRPYIDKVTLVCSCGGNLIRTKEVMDVWFDSGAMPFAQDHYPFDPKKILYPADFICEAVDQTRGWFYTLHAVGVLMGRGKAYKNVTCLGHLLDVAGKKMSKSLGNVVDPWVMIGKYGVDTLRLWMYSVNQPGESKNFDERTVALLHQQVFGLLYNVLAFYELYPIPEQARYGASRDKPKSKHVLDVWILARLDELTEMTTKNLDNYKLLEPVRAMRDFIGDLSTWYLRRSRERIKEGDKEAKQTLYFVLKNLAKLLAPFAPFAAEDIWLKLRNEDDKESVHLCEWPKMLKGILDIFSGEKNKVLKNMETVRQIVTLGLEARQKTGIKVRQPLGELKVKSLKLGGEFLEIMKEELNVGRILEDKNISEEVWLDTTITPELRAEGEYRDFMRELQDTRKKMGLAPGDKMAMSIETIYKKYKIIPSLQEHMLRVAAVASLICDNFNESLNKEEIITACLLHDMGNILKFKLDSFPEFLKPEGLSYWQKVKDGYVNKYGNDEYSASLKIAQELQVSDEVLELIKAISFLGAPGNALGIDYGKKIVEYCDDRVIPFGVVSLEQRFLDLRKRYEHRGGNTPERIAFENAVRQMEKQIFSKCKIRPEDINDKTVAPVIEQLKNFVIQ